MRSLARIGFERLLEMHATMDVLQVDWQTDGPWMLVTLGQRSQSDPDAVDVPFARYPFAIWKHTGAVHGVQADGAVTDEPLLRV